MAILTRGEIADLKSRSNVVNVRFSAHVVSDLIETIESLTKAFEHERDERLGEVLRRTAMKGGE